MPIIYVGRVAYYQGRPLWEIVLNLKDFGVGRIVGRNLYKRYSEVTYFRIVKVNPTVIEYPKSPVDRNNPITMKGQILAERTFRGVREDKLWDAGKIGYKPDFFLVPKHEEDAYMKSGTKPKENKTIYPKYMALPPLWQELIKRDKAMLGQKATAGDLRVPLLYKNKYIIKIAEDGETPSFDFWNVKPKRPELYPYLQENTAEDVKSSNK